MFPIYKQYKQEDLTKVLRKKKKIKKKIKKINGILVVASPSTLQETRVSFNS
jgi:hypothetical protein